MIRKPFVMVAFSVALACLCVLRTTAQAVSDRFVVYGDINPYYAVSFTDGGWEDNAATEMTLGRSSVHNDATWQGGLITKVRFHVTNWGNA